jgi:hypothetical protein
LVTTRTIALAALTAAACVPPAGLGAGPLEIPRRGGAAAVNVGAGASSKRETFQVDGSWVAKPARFFAIEGGLAYTLMRVDSEQGGELIAHSALPYARPTLVVGGAQLGVALTGFGMGGGGGGFFYGLFGVRAGYGGDDWSMYAEWMVHGSNVTSQNNSSESSSRQLRAGFDYEWNLGAKTRLGGALEIADIDEEFHGKGHSFDDRHVGVMLKLRVRSVFDKL